MGPNLEIRLARKDGIPIAAILEQYHRRTAVYIRRTRSHSIAFNLFFGLPVLIAEHHEVSQRPVSGRDRCKNQLCGV